MYRSTLDTRQRSSAIVAVAAIHAMLLLMLLHLPGRMGLGDPQQLLRTFDVRLAPPPPPPPPPPPVRTRERHVERAGGSSPKNIRSEATEIVAPKPQIVTPPIQQIAVVDTPRQGTSPSQGAADVRGPGTGSGGNGTGNGSGSGSGGGSGTGGGAAVPVALLRGISARDYPPGVMEEWPRGGAVFLRLRIEPDGRPSRCDVMRSFGNPNVDQWTCSLVMERGQFRPALDSRGTPVAAWFGYKQVDVGR